MDGEDHDEVVRILRREGFTRNQSRIIDFLDRNPDSSLTDLTLQLRITNARAISSLKDLLSYGFVQRMQIRRTYSRGRSHFIYRLKMSVNDIMEEARRMVEIIYVDYEHE